MDPSRDRPTVCILPAGQAQSSSSLSSSSSSAAPHAPHASSSSSRSRTPSVSSSLSWSQQQPLLHIHLMFVLLITASIWTYCMSRSSDFLSSQFFRISSNPNTHLLSQLYQQQESHLKSHVNSGAAFALAESPQSAAGSQLNGPAASAAVDKHKSSFSWSSSPYPAGNLMFILYRDSNSLLFHMTDNCDRESCNERSSYEAIRWIHRQLDDDANGDIDIEETDEVSYHK